MRVVLDSNIIIKSHFFFHSAEMQAILSAAEKLHIELLIPEVVYEEVSSHFERELEARLREYYAALGGLAELAGDHRPEQQSRSQLVGHQALNYAAFLRMRLGQPPFRMLWLPDISHREVLEAATRKRKPFGGRNDGYGDYLIWRSIIEELRRNSTDLPLYFVSENVHDFSNNPKGEPLEIHPDLLNDLSDNGLALEAVNYCRSVEEFRKRMVNPRLDFLGEVARQVKQRAFGNPQLYELIVPTVNVWLLQHATTTSPRSFGLSDVWSVEDAAAELLVSLEHADARILPNNELVIDVVAQVTCLFDVQAEPGTSLSERISDDSEHFGYHERLDGSVEEDVPFIVTSLVGPAPGYEIKRMDAILVARPAD